MLSFPYIQQLHGAEAFPCERGFKKKQIAMYTQFSICLLCPSALLKETTVYLLPPNFTLNNT
jgi:hypothetical protein